MSKTCKACRVEKVLTEFNADKKGIKGVRAVCKACVKHTREIGTLAMASQLKSCSTPILTKKCRGCDETKSLSEFYGNATGIGGVRATCKECVKEDIAIKKLIKIATPPTTPGKSRLNIITFIPPAADMVARATPVVALGPPFVLPLPTGT